MDKVSLSNYISQAEKCLLCLLEEWRPVLLASHGVQKYDFKSDNSVVTNLDRQLETAIKNALKTLGGDIGFVGEEHDREGNRDTFWLIDPIDGTEQYIRGMTGCRTLLALIDKGEPIYAFAYRFTTNDHYTAIKNKGAYKNGKQISRVNRSLDRSWIEVATDYSDKKSLSAIGRLAEKVHSIVYTKEFLSVVEGAIDGYVVMGHKGKEWDYAPRALMLSESGLKVTNLGKETYNYKNLSMVATNPDVHEQIQSLLSPQA